MGDWELNDQKGIAIIGMSCRYPGANNVDEYWQNLKDGRDSISFFSDEDLDEAGVELSLREMPTYVRAAGILDNVKGFDAAFFGYTPREAEVICPQQRLFLECAWETLERAGYDPERFDGMISVYAGVNRSTYMLNNVYSNMGYVLAVGDYLIGLGTDRNFVATRISYKLNLKGPSFTVQSACSTSLVATSLACQSLINYQCDMALIGGSAIHIPQKAGYFYYQGGILSPDGHCRPFDAQAHGTVGSNGVGAVLLRRLEDALENGDHIYAVIKGWAMNNDGSFKVGFTAPSVDSQSEVILMAQMLADVEPETISYVETHGTGTELGDPVEISALNRVFSANTNRKGFCAIGSVKSNFGHLDSAAGVASLMKTALALEHQLIPPSIHFEQPNPKIDFGAFYVNDHLAEWPPGETPRRAGISSFGIGGTNVHIIVEEAPPLQASDRSQDWNLLVLSAKTPSALDAAATGLAMRLKQQPKLNISDVAYTLQVGRKAFNQRRILVCRDGSDAIKAFETKDARRVLTSDREPGDYPVVFMFPGQGAHYVNMGRDLYQSEPTFRQYIDQCAQVLQPHLGLDLRRLLYPDEGQTEQAAQQLLQTGFAQPALFAVEYALAQVWMKWGVRPKAMVGHSIGEYVAACLAGVFSLEQALALVATRGQLMQSQPGGAMLVVPLPEQEVLPRLGHDLSLAAVNAPELCVVSGPTEAVDKLEQQLTDQGLDCRRLHTSHAFHSVMMAPILDEFTRQFDLFDLNPPQIPYLSNVSGDWITVEEATQPEYWAGHIRQAVRFSDNLKRLTHDPHWILLEVGPGHSLSLLAKQHLSQGGTQPVLASMRHPKSPSHDMEVLLTTLGQVWLTGGKIDWPAVHNRARRQRVILPTYPFERQEYWVNPEKSTVAERWDSLSKKTDMADWFYVPTWKRQVTEPGTITWGDIKAKWLVFLDESGLGRQLAQQLEEVGQSVIRVQAGAVFARLDDHSYQINPRQPADYETLLAQTPVVDRIVHLWSVTPTGAPGSELEHLDEVQDKGFYSLLFLAQALGKQDSIQALELDVVSNALWQVSDEERVCPEKATLLGAVKIIPLEYPYIKCRSLDMALPASGDFQTGQLVPQLLRALAASPSEAMLALRGAHTWIPALEAVPLQPGGDRPARLREKGVYLITGGLGGVGLSLAEYLAQSVQARLILVGRSALPAQSDWEQWLAEHAEEDAVSHKIRQIQAIQQLGSEVLVTAADVADLAQMQAVIAQARQRFGPIHGVIHSAGVADYQGVIHNRTRQATQDILAAKVTGTLVLDRLLSDAGLDFMVLCSTLGSVLYKLKFGQVGYCAANDFLDAFAHFKASQGGIPTITINWDDWQQVGMSVAASQWAQEHNVSYGSSESQAGLSPAEGIQIFQRVLDHSFPQVIVSVRDLPALAEQLKKQKMADLLEKAAPPETTHPRPELSTAYAAPSNDIEQKLAEICQDLLGIEMVGVHDNFYELGGHSLLATQLASRVRDILGVDLPLRRFLEVSTIAEWGLMIAQEQLGGAVDTQQLETLLSEVEGLSPDELQRLLSEE